METIKRNWRSAIPSRARAFLSHADFKMAVKMAIAASVSFLIGNWFYTVIEHPVTFISGLWCVMAAVVVMQSRLGGTYKAVWSRFFGILIGSFAGGFFIDILGESYYSILVGVFCTVLLCSLFNLADSIRIAGLSTALIIVSAIAKPEVDPWSFAFFRFVDSCIGMSVAVFVSYFIWPEKAMENMRHQSEKILGLLAKFYHRSTALDMKEADMKNAPALHHDIEEMLELNQTFCEEAELETLDKDQGLAHWKAFVAALDDLYALIASIERVHKEAVEMIIDDDLGRAIFKVIRESDAVLQNLENRISEPPRPLQAHTLKESIETLSVELTRFRSTHATRKFNIEHVESYFVYFYSLREIGESLLGMDALAEQL